LLLHCTSKPRPARRGKTICSDESVDWMLIFHASRELVEFAFSTRAPVKWVCSRVEVPPVELDGSRPNHCTRDEAARPNQKRVRMELSGRNEGEPHRMSLEKHRSGKASRCADGEGCHAASSNRRPGAVDSGGGSEDDTTGRSTQVSSRRGFASWALH
jgi:hypothetical protein